MPFWLQANQRCTFCWWASNSSSCFCWLLTCVLLGHHLSNKHETEHRGWTSSYIRFQVCLMKHACLAFSACKEWALKVKDVVVENIHLHNHGGIKLPWLETLQRKGVYDSKDIKSFWPGNRHQAREKQCLPELSVTCNDASQYLLNQIYC